MEFLRSIADAVSETVKNVLYPPMKYYSILDGVCTEMQWGMMDDNTRRHSLIQFFDDCMSCALNNLQGTVLTPYEYSMYMGVYFKFLYLRTFLTKKDSPMHEVITRFVTVRIPDSTCKNWGELLKKYPNPPDPKKIFLEIHNAGWKKEDDILEKGAERFTRKIHAYDTPFNIFYSNLVNEQPTMQFDFDIDPRITTKVVDASERHLVGLFMLESIYVPYDYRFPGGRIIAMRSQRHSYDNSMYIDKVTGTRISEKDLMRGEAMDYAKVEKTWRVTRALEFNAEDGDDAIFADIIEEPGTDSEKYVRSKIRYGMPWYVRVDNDPVFKAIHAHFRGTRPASRVVAEK